MARTTIGGLQGLQPAPEDPRGAAANGGVTCGSRNFDSGNALPIRTAPTEACRGMTQDAAQRVSDDKEEEMPSPGVAVLALVAACSMLALQAPGSVAQTAAPSVIVPQSTTAPPVVVIAPTAPPAPQVEVVPAPPVGQERVMVWQPGRWAWRDGAWSWQVGSYVMRPSESSTWIPGRWEVQPNGRYIWIEGRWG